MPAVFGEVSLAAFPFGDVGADFAEAVELGIEFVRYHALVLDIEVTGGEWIRNEERSGACLRKRQPELRRRS